MCNTSFKLNVDSRVLQNVLYYILKNVATYIKQNKKAVTFQLEKLTED